MPAVPFLWTRVPDSMKRRLWAEQQDLRLLLDCDYVTSPFKLLLPSQDALNSQLVSHKNPTFLTKLSSSTLLQQRKKVTDGTPEVNQRRPCDHWSRDEMVQPQAKEHPWLPEAKLKGPGGEKSADYPWGLPGYIPNDIWISSLWLPELRKNKPL